jgi:diaminohydroxyphosphoribosylaminopyrimidine deaminase/5-amino-6-(5-phosphoribosylamino)uracil reductase
MTDLQFMRLALRLARRGTGATSPNPTVGAVLVRDSKIIGRGRTAPAGGPHAEIEALRDAQQRGHSPRGATLYVTLEPCSTHGRTPPCTEAIIAAGIKRVVTGATDPNPKHAGNGFKILQRAGIKVVSLDGDSPSPRPSPPAGERVAEGRVRGRSFETKLADECVKLNETFNHWIVHRTPFVTVKAAMTLDGKIATASGESKWITGEKAREHGMQLRRNSDAILVGINTILADDPSLTARAKMENGRWKMAKPIRRIVLDSLARTPRTAKIVSDEFRALTTIVVSKAAPKKRVAALAKRVNVLVAPSSNSKLKIKNSKLDLKWLLKKLGAENVTSLLVEGGGEVNASFLLGGCAQRVAFFYAPKILGGRDSRKGVAGDGAKSLSEVIQLHEVEWRKLGEDLLLLARVNS